MQITTFLKVIFSLLGLAAGSSLGASVTNNGSWERACVNEHGDSMSDRVLLKFDGDQYEVVEKVYRYNDCHGLAVEFHNSGKFQKEEVSGVSYISYTATRTRMRTMDDYATEVSNLHRDCGFSDWKTGEYEDVSATDCKQNGLLAERKYDIIRFEQTRLFIGTVPLGVHWDKVGRTPAERPKEFDPVSFDRK